MSSTAQAGEQYSRLGTSVHEELYPKGLPLRSFYSRLPRAIH